MERSKEKLNMRSGILLLWDYTGYVVLAWSGQLSMYLSPHFQEQYHQQLLPALIEVFDDLIFLESNLSITSATSAMPLLLNSAPCATKKGRPVTGCGKSLVQTISNTIILA
ncbi:hypothetical protein KY289_007244 [Solanum tuberosum]|nr:hypothetical protein KY289_007244 [Solanum tuberosum]